MPDHTQAPKIALLAANGVTEAEMTAIQRTLGAKRWVATVISPESGLIHSWAENVWGHCYPSDAKIEISLGSDYDMLILPGGPRHVEKLMANPHTRRFVSAFFMMNKPVAAFVEAEQILTANMLEGPEAKIYQYTSPEGLMEQANLMLQQFVQFQASAPVQQAA